MNPKTRLVFFLQLPRCDKLALQKDKATTSQIMKPHGKKHGGEASKSGTFRALPEPKELDFQGEARAQHQATEIQTDAGRAVAISVAVQLESFQKTRAAGR